MQQKQPKMNHRGKSDKEQAENYQEHQQFLKNRLEKMFTCPPNDEQAEIHKAASAFGYTPMAQKGQKITVCPCCQLPINNIPLPLSIPTTPSTGQDKQRQFFVLDSGASLFFTFIKIMIIYSAILLLISNLYPIHISYISNEYCKIYPEECGKSWFINFSPVKFSNTKFDYNYSIINVLNIIMVGFSIVLFVYYRRYQYNIFGVLDVADASQDDFTILVKNIPIEIKGLGSGEQVHYEKNIKKLFESKIDNFLKEVADKQCNNINSQHVSMRKWVKNKKRDPSNMNKINSISLCFDMAELQQLIQQRNILLQQQLKGGAVETHEGSQKLDQQQIQSIPLKIQKLNQKYLQLCKRFLQNKSLQFNKQKFIGKAFVSFEFQHYRNYILHLQQSAPEQLSINGQTLKINLATTPDDVFWFNLKIGKWSRIFKIIISFIAVFIVLAIVFAVITAIELGQEKIDETQIGNEDNLYNKGISYGITVLVALIIYLVNYILAIAMRYLTDREKHETKTKHMLSLIIKMFAAQFLNSAGMYFLLSFRQGQHYLQDDGLVVQISNLLIISGFLSVPLNFFQIDGKVQTLWRKFRYGFLKHDYLFQIQYNELYQLPQFDFADRYCYYLVQLFTLVFYSFINPICTPAIIIISILHYWVDKYNLIKCSSNTFRMNFVISRITLKIFELSVVIFAGANYYFSLRLTGQFSLINFIALMVAAGYCVIAVLAPAYVQDKIFGSEHEIQFKTYDQCIQLKLFKHTYWGCNPATMFTPQPNLNQQNEYFNYGVRCKLAKIEDLKETQQKAAKILLQ